MTDREKTAYQSHKDGEYPEISTFSDGKQVFLESLKNIMLVWIVVSLILAIFIYFIFRPSTPDLFLFLSIANLILTILMIYGSGISGNTAVQNPLMYVGGTGVEDEMIDAKKRANSFSMPLVSLIHSVVAFICYILLITFV